MKGDIKMEINGPTSSLKPEVQKKEAGVFKVTYIPTEIGEHLVKISWNGHEINGSPFRPQVVNPEKIRIIGAGQDPKGRIPLAVNETKDILIDKREAGEGKKKRFLYFDLKVKKSRDFVVPLFQIIT